MVIKTVRMGIPILVSRSGFTAWGVELARKANLTLIGRARGKRFVALAGEDRIVFDQDLALRGGGSASTGARPRCMTIETWTRYAGAADPRRSSRRAGWRGAWAAATRPALRDRRLAPSSSAC